jgi:hypothetical protein
MHVRIKEYVESQLSKQGTLQLLVDQELRRYSVLHVRWLRVCPCRQQMLPPT